MKIGIDIMGGDFAPSKIVQGAILAHKEVKNESQIFLFGIKKSILSELEKLNYSSKNFTIIDCPEIIEMGDHPIKTLKQKTKSSINIGLEYLSDGKIDGFASAGNTGAVYAGGFFYIKSIDGVIRPCISSLLPKENGGVGLLLDVGANADCKSDVLYQFGILGSLFAENVCNIKEPKVGLLNLGEEKTKGNMLTQAAYRLMEGTKDFNFIGNVESRNLLNDHCDVIVCDGFTGNIVLKEIEAFHQIIKKRGYEDDYFKRLNYENYGGTPILGINKTVIIGHGISNEKAIKNMIILTKNVIKADLGTKIKKRLK
tara:strand:+ start:10588 stop:11526 length:939 start_codon:yes stop_codon:yes gene_type:complete